MIGLLGPIVDALMRADRLGDLLAGGEQRVSDFIGSWKMIDTRLPRICRIARFVVRQQVGFDLPLRWVERRAVPWTGRS